MSNSEIINRFDERREEFKPYGLTCELWIPHLMKRADRHNEIEINYLTKGSMTYLIQGRHLTIPAKKVAIFWGLIPHQIVKYEGDSPYYVCTIPFNQFLEWKFPNAFLDRILKGEIILAANEESAVHDEYLLRQWISDLRNKDAIGVVFLEMQARLARLAISNLAVQESSPSTYSSKDTSQVVKIAVFIAQNYSNPIKAADIGTAVGLHPDYANAIFKKALGCTIRDYIIEERIAHAKRKLITTDHSITEIAFECGFNSISRFNAAFQKLTNCTPREFRKYGVLST